MGSRNANQDRELMKRLVILLPLLGLLSHTTLCAQSLAQDPFAYQYLAGRATDYSWQLNGILFREDPAVPMLMRSFTNNFLYHYRISNSIPALEYGNGKGFAGSQQVYFNTGRHFYSIADAGLSMMNGASINSNLNRNSDKYQSLKVLINHQLEKNRLDINNDGLLDRPLKNDINTCLLHYWRPSQTTYITTAFTALRERWDLRNSGEVQFQHPSWMNISHGSEYYGLRNTFQKYVGDERQSIDADVQGSVFHQHSSTGRYWYDIKDKKVTCLAGWNSNDKWNYTKASAKLLYNAERLYEMLDSLRLDRSSLTGGTFFELGTKLRPAIRIELRYKGTYNTIHGWNHAPLARLEITKLKSLKISPYAMLDEQMVHPLATNLHLITGTRRAVWDGNTRDRYARAGINVNQAYWQRKFVSRASYNYTHYFKRNIADVYTAPDMIYLYSLEGASRDHTVEAEVRSSNLVKHLHTNLLYRFDDVKASFNNKWRQLPFYPRHSLMLDLSYQHSQSYSYRRYPLLTATVLYSTGIYEPITNNGSIEKAPGLLTLHARAYIPLEVLDIGKDEDAGRKWHKWLKLTLSCDNITGVKRYGVITTMPGDPGYEGPVSRGPLSGRRFYFGLALTPQQKNNY
jgi:hypothetical protein